MPDSATPTDGPDAGDNVRFVDDLAIGDLCYFDRDWDGSWLVRRLDDLRLWTFDRQLLVLTQGDSPNSGSLRVLGEGEIRSLLNTEG